MQLRCLVQLSCWAHLSAYAAQRCAAVHLPESKCGPVYAVLISKDDMTAKCILFDTCNAARSMFNSR